MRDAAPQTATYGALFRVREFRAIFVANALSVGGDMLARVAVTVLVFEHTGSSLLSAAAFAVSYLPSVVGGPLLATVADRLPWRTTLVGCDLIRALLVALIAIPGIPLWLALLALFTSALITAPFDAARTALLPTVLTGDEYVLGVTVTNVTFQLGQIVGFVAGGALVAAISPASALLIDAATFLASAALLSMFVHRRPAPDASTRHSLFRDTIDGLQLILGHRVLRRVVLLAWLTSTFAFAHEGLAAPLADELDRDADVIGLLLAASPFGVVVGGLALTRLVPHPLQLRLAPWLAIVACLALIPAGVTGAPVGWVLACFVVSGIGMSFMLPINAAFNRMVPVAYRGRAAGVVIAGLMAGQGIGIVGAGALANYVAVGTVITASGVVGALVTVVLLIGWPGARALTTPVTAPAPAPVPADVDSASDPAAPRHYHRRSVMERTFHNTAAV